MSRYSIAIAIAMCEPNMVMAYFLDYLSDSHARTKQGNGTFPGITFPGILLFPGMINSANQTPP